MERLIPQDNVPTLVHSDEYANRDLATVKEFGIRTASLPTLPDTLGANEEVQRVLPRRQSRSASHEGDR